MSVAAPVTEPRHGVSTTLLLSAASVAMALVAMFGEEGSFSTLTAAAALVGLVPWALVAGGINVPPPLFALMGLAPAAVIVVGAENAGGMFPIMLVVVWITRTSRTRWLIAATIAAGVACIVSLAMIQGSAHESGMIYFIGGIGISWLAGLMLRRQEALTVEVQAMHDLQVEQLAASERTRIAREVHDVVAHSLTIVMLNVTGARRALATQPERADEALARAESVGRESLDSIRQIMGLLREPGSGLDLPQPGLTDLGALVEGYRSAGLVATCDVDADLVTSGIDPTVQLVAYRVVQESLANVLQHAPGATASVGVAADAPSGRLRVAVVNSGRTGSVSYSTASRTGLGVRGMTERVRAVGGDLQAGPSDGGWQVVAMMPARLSPAMVGSDDKTAWATQPTSG